MRASLLFVLALAVLTGCKLEPRQPVGAAEPTAEGVAPAPMPDRPPPPGTQPAPPPDALTNTTTPDGKAAVVLYVTEWRPYCRAAREYMAAEDIPHTVVDIEKDEAGAREYQARGGTGGIPLVAVGTNVMEGWNEDIARDMLDKGGYD